MFQISVTGLTRNIWLQDDRQFVTRMLGLGYTHSTICQIFAEVYLLMYISTKFMCSIFSPSRQLFRWHWGILKIRIRDHISTTQLQNRIYLNVEDIKTTYKRSLNTVTNVHASRSTNMYLELNVDENKPSLCKWMKGALYIGKHCYSNYLDIDMSTWLCNCWSRPCDGYIQIRPRQIKVTVSAVD